MCTFLSTREYPRGEDAGFGESMYYIQYGCWNKQSKSILNGGQRFLELYKSVKIKHKNYIKIINIIKIISN